MALLSVPYTESVAFFGSVTVYIASDIHLTCVLRQPFNILFHVFLCRIVATVVSMGAAGVPAGGLVYVIVVLEACGLPTNDIGPILAVEWFL